MPITDMEGRPKWKSDSLALMRKRQKVNRRFRRLFVGIIGFYIFMLFIHTLEWRYWRMLADGVLIFAFWGCWLGARKVEHHWTEVLHHALRMQVETDERFLWHSQQIERVMNELKRL
jgi:hypothetical protein